MIALSSSHGTPLECIDERRSFLLTLHCSAVRRFAYRNCVGIDNMDSAPCPDGWGISIALIIHSLDSTLQAAAARLRTSPEREGFRRDSEIAPIISIGWCAVHTLLQHRDLEIAPRRGKGLIAPSSSHGTPLECIDECRSFLLTLDCSAVRRFTYRNCVGIDNMDSAPCPDGWGISIAVVIHSVDPPECRT